jgi:hypothetical protein
VFVQTSLALNNSRAVLEGLIGSGGSFHRTPKFRIEGPSDEWPRRRYRSPVSIWVVLELGLGAYFAWVMVSLAQAKLYAPLPFFALYLFGFLYVGLVSLVHAARRA